MPNKEKIEEILRGQLKVYKLELIDESFKHAGHNDDAKKGGTHMQLLIVSDDFKGRRLIERHKLIYKILDDQFKDGLHALAIKALTIEEAEAQSL